MKNTVLWLTRNAQDDPPAELEVHGIGLEEMMQPGIVHRPNGTADHLLMHFHDAVDVRAGGETLRRSPGCLMVWRPGAEHLYGLAGEPWEHSWLHCGWSRLPALLAENGVPVNTPLDVPDGRPTMRALAAIHDEVVRNARPDPVILESLLTIWVREIARVSSPTVTAPEIPERFLRTRRYIETHLAAPFTLAQLADLCGLSVSQFCAEFKRHFGQAPIHFVLSLRMQQAAYYLADVTLTVSDVGERVGIADPFYFSKQFKKRYGMSPTAYRTTLLRPPVLP